MDNSNCGVYAIINSVNGKIYIGSSKNLRKRKHNHFSRLRNNKHINEHLQKAWNKYGEDSFEWKVIRNCKEEKLLNIEQRYINKYNSTNSNCGYNMMLRADRMIISEEIREKISKAGKGRICTTETRRKLRESNLGQKRSKETKKRISESCKGRICTVETRKKFSKLYSGENNPMFGREHTLETKGKMRLKGLGRKHTPETKEKFKKINSGKNNGMYGRKHTLETKEKISAARIGKKIARETVKKQGVSKMKYQCLASKWKDLYTNGYNLKEIAKQYNVSPHTVRNYIKGTHKCLA